MPLLMFKRRTLVLYGIFTPLLVFCVLGGTCITAFADSGVHARAVVKGGTLSLHGFKSGTKSITVGTKKTAQTKSYTLSLSIVDARGNGGGWNLTITSTQFSTGGAAPHTLATNASTMNASPQTVCIENDTCTLPVNLVSYVHPLTVPAGIKAPAAVKFYSAAAHTGLGSFAITPTITISIPANTYAGVYSSIVTVTIVSGP